MNLLLLGLILMVAGGFIFDKCEMPMTGIPLSFSGLLCFLGGFVTIIF